MTEKKTLVFATNNRHKLEELRQIVSDKINILSLDDINCHDDIPETHSTLEENALEKAMWVKEKYGYDCFADDTGLEVDCLGGEPGVKSARYASEKGHDSVANMELLLKNMYGKENRSARFRTVIVLVEGDEKHQFEGVVEGKILEFPCGTGGFGYDPVFCPEGWNKTFADATPEEKNGVSHRGRATRALINHLNNI